MSLDEGLESWEKINQQLKKENQHEKNEKINMKN